MCHASLLAMMRIKLNKVFARDVDTQVMCIQRSGLASQNANRNINPGAAPLRK